MKGSLLTVLATSALLAVGACERPPAEEQVPATEEAVPPAPAAPMDTMPAVPMDTPMTQPDTAPGTSG